VGDSTKTRVIAQPTAMQVRAYGQRNDTGISDAQQQSVNQVTTKILETPAPWRTPK
jgi:hypothetical protein